jgi:WG containing repeat
MRIFFTVAVAFISIIAANSQTLVARVMSPKTSHWGYCTIKGEMIVPPDLRRSSDFCPEGLAAVFARDGRDYYFINVKNERVPTEVKDYRLVNAGFFIKGFSDGLVPVKTSHWGYMDPRGHLAFEATYDMVHEFNGGSAIARRNGQHMVLNKKGEEFPFKADDTRNFREGLAPFLIDGRYGFIDPEGKVAIAPAYKYASVFKNGYAWVKALDRQRQIGFIDKTGKWILEPQFSAVGPFDSVYGLAAVKRGSVWGFINIKGEMVLTPDADYYEDFSEGLAMGIKGGKIGFFNDKGEWIIAPKFDKCRNFKNGYAAALLGGRWGAIDKTGEWVIKPQFKKMLDFEVVND